MYVKDGLIYNQANATLFFGGTQILFDFGHNHVLRSCLTDLVNGETLTGTNNGETITRNFSIPVLSNISNASNISF